MLYAYRYTMLESNRFPKRWKLSHYYIDILLFLLIASFFKFKKSKIRDRPTCCCLAEKNPIKYLLLSYSVARVLFIFETSAVFSQRIIKNHTMIDRW